jgi:O-methyltransferase
VRVEMAVELSERNPVMSSIDHLNAVYWCLSSVLFYKIPGAVVEVGCNAGYTSAWIQQIIQDAAPEREFHLFDSFQGMPEPGTHDDWVKGGELAVTVDDVKANLAGWKLPMPTIHPGWFEDTLPVSCPPQICFAYLDGDFYDSIKTSLEHVYPRLAPGGAILIDDYGDRSVNPRAWDGFKGVKLACDDYFADRPVRREVLLGVDDLGMALIRKPLDEAPA